MECLARGEERGYSKNYTVTLIGLLIKGTGTGRAMPGRTVLPLLAPKFAHTTPELYLLLEVPGTKLPACVIGSDGGSLALVRDREARWLPS